MPTAEDRAERIRAIVDAARELPGEKRDTYINGVCGDDAQLRLEVEVVLARLDEQVTRGRGRLEFDFDDLLASTAEGDASAANRFWLLVYDDLHIIGRSLLRRQSPQPALPETASLVLRAVDRLLNAKDFPAKNREYFFGAAKLAMRRILHEILRAQPGPTPDSELLQNIQARFGLIENSVDLLVLYDALNRMQSKFPRPTEVVRLRIFNGLSVLETARALGVSDRTVESDWALARAWLRRELTKQKQGT